MVTQAQFDYIKEKHGAYASWAVWADADKTPTSNIGDMRVLDPSQNPKLLAQLNPAVVMLGLNISRPVVEPLSNFHDKRSHAKDYKIRHAFTGTRYYGAYMTDVLKFYEEVESATVMADVRTNPRLRNESADLLRAEFADLSKTPPEIIAFGGDAYNLAKKVLSPTDYFRLIKVTHYSHFIGKEKYRDQVLRQCE